MTLPISRGCVDAYWTLTRLGLRLPDANYPLCNLHSGQPLRIGTTGAPGSQGAVQCAILKGGALSGLLRK